MTGLKESVRGVESRWSKVLARLEKKVEAAKMAGSKKAKRELSEVKLQTLALSASRERTISTGKDDAPLLTEFREKFQAVNAWIDSTEAKLLSIKLSSKANDERSNLGNEVEEWKPKVRDLRSLAEKLVEMFVGQKEDVEPEMKKLGQRWEEIVSQVEKRFAEKKSFKMVEVETTKTTISKMTIPTTKVSAAVAMGAEGEDEDDVIDTLPEENASSSNSNLKRRLPNELALNDLKRSRDENKTGLLRESNSPLLPSSRESSPDLEVVTGTMILKTNSPTFIRETVSKVPKSKSNSSKSESSKQTAKTTNSTNDKATSPMKTPPKTLPKPSWFNLEQHSPEHRAMEDEDDFIAKENSAIERILNEATSELAEVRRKASHGTGYNRNPADYQQKEIREFDDNVSNMLAKIDRAKEKLNQLDNEQDLKLRQDLIGMESKVIEAEVATLISRGDTLVLLTHRSDLAKSDSLQKRVTNLREAWQGLKRFAEDKSRSTREREKALAQFKKEVDEMKNWISESNGRFKRASHDEGVAKKLLSDISSKQSDVTKLNSQGAHLKVQQGINTQGIVLTMMNQQWEDLLDRARKLNKEGKAIDKNVVSNSPPDVSPSKHTNGTTVNSLANTNKAASEILTRIEKMREAVTAIDRQLNTQVLAGKPFENLSEQEKALDLAKMALEKLRPTIKKTAKDLEVLTGSLSVEYLEKIVALSEKLRDEWQSVNKRYTERQAVWLNSNERQVKYDSKKAELEEWLDHAEKILLKSTHHNDGSNTNHGTPPSSVLQEQLQIERQVSEKNKVVTEWAMLGKDLRGKTSAQESLEIQTQVDKVLKRWKFLLSQLSAHRDRLNREKYNNNVNYMNHWINDNMSRIKAAVNVSDSLALKEAIEMVESYDDTLAEKQKQMDKLANSNVAISSDVIQKLKKKYDLLVSTIPKRREELKGKSEKLNSLTSRVITAEIWVHHTAIKLEDAKKSPAKLEAVSHLLQLIREKEGEVNDIFNSYQTLVAEVQQSNFNVDKDIEIKVTSFEQEWQSLTSDCRQSLNSEKSAASIPLSSSPNPLPSSKKSSSHKAPTSSPLVSLALPRRASTNGGGETRESLRKRSGIGSSSSDQKHQQQQQQQQQQGLLPEYRAPQIYASLRDHRDWVHRRNCQLAALTLGGDVGSVQRQADEHQKFR